ncbi:3019_t:CDS:2, partial [Scutellospora calospora]
RNDSDGVSYLGPVLVVAVSPIREKYFAYVRPEDPLTGTMIFCGNK